MKLINFGFSLNEEKVYLACLELGLAPISVIAKKANLKRTTVYEVIKKLAKKGVSELFFEKQYSFLHSSRTQ
jgi:sugar-specific transcriptional regulator TrmB